MPLGHPVEELVILSVGFYNSTEVLTMSEGFHIVLLACSIKSPSGCQHKKCGFVYGVLSEAGNMKVHSH